MAGLANLARETTATTGTGTITLSGAALGCLTFALAAAAAGIASGSTVTYGIEDGSNSEVGRGVWTTPSTLTRVTILASTNANSAINLSGTAEVFIIAAAEDIGCRPIARASPTGTAVATFSSIPQHYRSLLVTGIARSTAGTSPNAAVLTTFNNDTGSNYNAHAQQLQNTTNGANAPAGAANIDLWLCPWSAATANYFGSFDAKIINYANTTTFKDMIGQTASMGADTAGVSWLLRSGHGVWRSTAAITRIDFTMNAGNFETGSQIDLYGLI